MYITTNMNAYKNDKICLVNRFPTRLYDYHKNIIKYYIPVEG